MKTLIINGSPRSNGNTHILIDVLLKGLIGEYCIIDAYYSNISPCTDCRQCQKGTGCVKRDDMTVLYNYIHDCSNIVIASPIYFGELTPPVLSIGSRLQAFYFAHRLSNTEQGSINKKGGIMLTGGGSSGSDECAVKTAKILLKQMGAKDIFDPVGSLNTDKIPASEDREAIKEISKLINFLNNV